ncbi:hypothetical protein CSB45_02465 [candidate division KSB3 bacterium]|uniref:Uncharacterized protein n=1 Tax=candidate division KSB3 bacterium TaxID=2044937 RepID=A0A2G6EAL2_9BACT|nr:MAG: hypothetical protein CSB45_02465 [candidate division KSB3 bacterium]PIE30944.1 MAG: hypothetical protein CSA57_01080 [candidate division KSB3 bacterium]
MTALHTQEIHLSQFEIPVQRLAERRSTGCDRQLHPWIAERCGIRQEDILDYSILHRSLDARKKPHLRVVYTLKAIVAEGLPIAEDRHLRIQTPQADQEDPLYQLATLNELPRQPIVVGSGPAGIMAAYLLALYGCQPLILDRGFDVDRRRSDIENFHQSRCLNPESNYLFGEGGAGTYSDGKLYTRIKDRRIAFLLNAYVAARAPRRILYDHHPHIGSDILPHMVKRLRRQIEDWGGSFRWGAAVQDIIIRDQRCQGVVLRNGERLDAPLTLIACGHSARDLILKLVQRGIRHRLKDFQTGCRIEHPQEFIDRSQYGVIPPRGIVGAAEYRMTSRPPAYSGIAGVTTFCMCPGGEIIASTSDEAQLCTNGMSPFLRNGCYANAGLIVNQDASQYASAQEVFATLARLEQQAFSAGAGRDNSAPYCCPAQSASAFVRGEAGLQRSDSSYRLGIRSGRIDMLLPARTTAALREGLCYFERIIPGFLHSGTLIGIETRVSCPVRFERNPDTLSSSVPGLYLAGEAAGYAGGISSSALDGLRIAETILTGKRAKRK